MVQVKAEAGKVAAFRASLRKLADVYVSDAYCPPPYVYIHIYMYIYIYICIYMYIYIRVRVLLLWGETTLLDRSVRGGPGTSPM